MMHILDLTLDDPAANLALDEALLEHAEVNPQEPEVLRFWEPMEPLVVLGRSSPIETEVNLDYCRDHHIPILRRCSGGATIVTGPGCLMYALRLSYRERSELRMLDRTHQFVLEQMQSALAQPGKEIQIKGTSDLAIGERKFSGNSMRCRRTGFLYHGTLLCDFDLQLVSDCLGWPQRQPDYRRQRSHEAFLTNLKIDVGELKYRIAQQWQSGQPLLQWPQALTNRLRNEKYLREEWTVKRRQSTS